MIRYAIFLIPGIFFAMQGFIGCTGSTSGRQFKSQNEFSLGKQDDNRDKNPDVKFLDSTTYNFGQIKAGDTVIHKFLFRNTGIESIIIKSATASCGCTVAYFNKKPIDAGRTDSIVTTFISTGSNPGFQNKVVTVLFNTSTLPALLTIYGKVK